MNCPWCGAASKRTENVGLYFECDSVVQPDSVLSREQSDTCKLAVALTALERIADPLAEVRAEAARTGGRIDGQAAVHFSNDANRMKDIAREAIAKVRGNK